MARRRGPLAAAAGLLLAALAVVAPAPVDATPTTVPAGTVVFRSDFTTWDGRFTVDGGKSVAWVSDGVLALGLDMDPAGWVRQARLETDESFAFTYGTVRARVKFIGPKGAHSAVWAQSFDRHGSAFCIDGCTELDVVEHLGSLTNVWHNLYWCPCAVDADGDPIYQNRRQVEDVLDASDWHTYRLDWTPTGYTFYVDGVVTAAWDVGLSNQPHMLVLSYLISAWERDNLDRAHLGRYRTYVDWVEVKANGSTVIDTAPVAS